jgi:predicted XRE-type DNA-binding protein
LIECKEINESNVYDYINEFINKKGIEASDLRSPAFKSEREEIIKLLLEKSSLSQRGIAVLLGLSREMVRRTVVSLHLSP